MPNMQLNNISSASGYMQVERGGQPPPVNVGDQGAVYSGDAILAAAGASATVENTDDNNAMIVSMSDAPPSVEVNWEQVLQVDEYYNPTTGGYDQWITTIDESIVVVRG